MASSFAAAQPSGDSAFLAGNAPSDLSGLCREVGLLLNLEDPAELQAGTWIGGERVCLFHDDDLDEGVYLFIDVGSLPQGSGATETLIGLMDVNLELSPEQGASFGFDSKSGRILFRAFMRDTEKTAEMIAREILLHVDMMGELRQGLLAGCPPASRSAS